MDTTGTIFPPGPELEKMGIPKLGGQFETPSRDTVLYLHITSTEDPRSSHHPGEVVHYWLEDLEWVDDGGDPHLRASGFTLVEGCTGHYNAPCPGCHGETCCNGWVEYDEPALFEAGNGAVLDPDWEPAEFGELCDQMGLDPGDYKSLSDH